MRLLLLIALLFLTCSAPVDIKFASKEVKEGTNNLDSIVRYTMREYPVEWKGYEIVHSTNSINLNESFILIILSDDCKEFNVHKGCFTSTDAAGVTFMMPQKYFNGNYYSLIYINKDSFIKMHPVEARNVVMHEMGHALGLWHMPFIDSIMYHQVNPHQKYTLDMHYAIQRLWNKRPAPYVYLMP